MKLHSLVLGLMFISVGCTSTQKKFESINPPSGSGVVYLYRPNLLTSAFLKVQLATNGKQGVLTNGSYLAWVLPEGEHEISSYCPDESRDEKDLCPAQIKLRVIPGEEHFVRFNAGGGKDIASDLKDLVGRVTNEKVENDKKGFLQYVGRNEGRSEIKDLQPSK